MHTVNWPLKVDSYGGTFMYHVNPNQIHVGFVVGLDYKNPYLNPYEEFQRFKHHPEISKVLKGGKCIEYGARVINEGGYHSIPKLTFPGGMLAGCSAGFLDVAAIKGSHTAMKSGMMAAESIFDHLEANGEESLEGAEMKSYEQKIKDSWVVKDLKKSRNFKLGFDYGLWFGLAHGFLTTLTKGREPWTLKHKIRDSEETLPASEADRIVYPKPDGVLSFDILTNLSRSGTNHEHD